MLRYTVYYVVVVTVCVQCYTNEMGNVEIEMIEGTRNGHIGTLVYERARH